MSCTLPFITLKRYFRSRRGLNFFEIYQAEGSDILRPSFFFDPITGGVEKSNFIRRYLFFRLFSKFTYEKWVEPVDTRTKKAKLNTRGVVEEEEEEAPLHEYTISWPPPRVSGR